MDEEAARLRTDPVGMKDENVSFDRPPCHEQRDGHVHRSIDEDPREAERRRRRQWSTRAVEVGIPHDISDFVEKAK